IPAPEGAPPAWPIERACAEVGAHNARNASRAETVRGCCSLGSLSAQHSQKLARSDPGRHPLKPRPPISCFDITPEPGNDQAKHEGDPGMLRVLDATDRRGPPSRSARA